MSIAKLDDMVTRGRTGKNVGFNMSSVRLNRYLNRFQRARYLLIGADSGVGKTTVADAILFAVMKDALLAGVKVHVKYFSFELSKEDKIMSWICMVLSRDLGFECTPDYIFGRIPGKPLTDEHHKLYLAARLTVENDYLPHIDLIDFPLTSTGMFRVWMEHYEATGYVHREASTTDKNGKEVKGKLIGYDADSEWENALRLGVIDHVALGTPERGQDMKRMIDAISRKVVISRNILGTSWIVIQQFNTEMNSSHRNLTGKGKMETLIAPNRLDFGDSKYTFRDADYVVGLISPGQYGLTKFMEYDVKKMDGNLLIAYLMKNRYGPAMKVLPLFFNPLARRISDMPPAVHTPALDDIYERALKLQEECLLYFPPEDGLQ